MSAFPTIIAWSWGADEYHRAARRLQARCEELGYPHDIEVGVDLSEHMAAMIPGEPWEGRMWVYRYIPGFIQRGLDRHGDVLYLHADLAIVEPVPPGTFDDMDIGLEAAWSQRPPRPDTHVLAAPIFVRDTEPARRFLRLWTAHCANVNDNRSEHEQLLTTWRLMAQWDRTLRVRTFDPPLGSIRADSDTPIRGHK